MYEMKQRPGAQSKVAGVIAAVFMTGVAGYALTSGLVQDVIRKIDTPTTITLIEAPEEPEIKPLPEPEIEVPPVDVQPELIPIPEDIPVFEEPLIVAPVAEPAPVVADPVPVAPAAGTDRRPPKLRAGDKPPYPAAAIRAKEQGTTGIEVCVSNAGRVTSANLQRSSGSPRLDAAALQWVRAARFAPGSVGGVPQSMCGHEVYYEWNLRDAA